MADLQESRFDLTATVVTVVEVLIEHFVIVLIVRCLTIFCLELNTIYIYIYMYIYVYINIYVYTYIYIYMYN